MTNRLKSPKRQHKLILASTSFLILLIIAGIAFTIFRPHGDKTLPVSSNSNTAIPSQTGQVPSTPLASTTPGVRLYGSVRDENGVGVEGVLIYRNYASYQGEVIAVTDPKGYYESEFYAIPGDEMIGLWAEKPGYSFKPQAYQWRHYYGVEDAKHDFSAHRP